jgi:hypothetical protein
MDRRLQKICTILREMMVANSPGTSGGFSDKSDSSGPVAGYSKKIYLGRGSRKRWMKDNVRKNQSS